MVQAPNTPLVAATVACLVAGCDAFTPFLTGKSVAVVNSFRSQALSPLFAESDPKDGTTITSARKEIGYDATSGRFFETDIDPEDCVPDDEYCVVDKDSGDLVRLTLEEKERIFLDALQVSTIYMIAGVLCLHINVIVAIFLLTL